MVKTLSKIACLLLGLAVLSAGGLALAQPPGGAPPPPPDCADLREPPPDRERHLQASLQKLVEDGVISQPQADKVLGFFQEKARERQADFAQMKSMTPEERQSFMEQKKGPKPDLIGDLIQYAGLSEDQAETVAGALRPPAPPDGKAPDR
ncbi:MAG TPA: hypothetical protein PKA10_13590 [Selenomonadales bacterium]|nr:hypothetical protein [Selenomonadales bacterium]